MNINFNVQSEPENKCNYELLGLSNLVYYC